MIVLGISASRRDSAVAVVRDGEIVAAAAEERFSRVKHQGGFPARAMAWCLSAAGIRIDDVDVVATCGSAVPALPGARRVEAVEPIVAGAAAAFLPSPFARAAVLVLGEAGSALAVGDGGKLAILETAPDVVCARYAAVTAHLGFRPRAAEFKVMGLAPYGTPRFVAQLREGDLAAIGAPRVPETPLTQAHMDLAASIQALTEESILGLARRARAASGCERLCLGGGMALNCVANAKVLREFADIWVQPAADDLALGAALAVAFCDRPREARDRMRGMALGPGFGDEEIAGGLRELGARFTVLSEAELVAACAEALDSGQVVGWFLGRMEFGPRALGQRSILGDARNPAMRDRLNRDVKFREPFRPFAPAVPREDAAAWFDLDRDSPYMTRVALARPGLPAVTHVDGSARVQTVDAAANPRFHALLAAFGARTGCPVLVNTSFNVRGEPIVATPEEAFRCFMATEIDLLAIGDCLLRKAEQEPVAAAGRRRFTD